jgi:hypothetical protein
MIEILLLSILVLAAGGYTGLWLLSKRRVRGRKALPAWEPVAVKEIGPGNASVKVKMHRDAEEDWLVLYALGMSPSERANMEKVWSEYVQRQGPRTQLERDRLRRKFLIMVARKKIEREMGGNA